MVNISKQKLSQEAEAELFIQFTDLFTAAGEKDISDLFNALFSEAEKTMFIKRVGVVLLLSKECSNYRIAKTLKVSDATVRTIKQQMKHGRYDALLTIFKDTSFNTQSFLKVLETLLQAGLPPQGRGRWRWLYEIE